MRRLIFHSPAPAPHGESRSYEDMGFAKTHLSFIFTRSPAERVDRVKCEDISSIHLRLFPREEA